MTVCYWDTSALLALLMPEADTRRARELAVRRGGLPGYTSFLTFVEMEAAYARRLAEGSLTSQDMARLRLDAQKLESALAVIWADAAVLADARRLVPEMGLKPADALQLASARLVAAGQGARADPSSGRGASWSRTAFVSLDQRLNAAAQAAGLELPW